MATTSGCATNSSSQGVPTQRRQVPLQLRQVSSRKGIKYTKVQLAAKKPRVELTLKQKSDIVNEAKKMGFQPGNIRTLDVNQAQLAKVL